jgi:outer membrane receptor protein involved in Fe transport
LVAALAPGLLPEVSQPFPLIVQNLGNVDLKEESVTAYEIAYTGTFNGKTTVGLAVYQNDQDDNINFVSLVDNPTLPGFAIYTPADPPPGVSPQLTAFLAALPRNSAAPSCSPRSVGTYLNLGPTRQRGLEASIDHAFNSHWTAFANYSWQDMPEILDAEADQIPYPTSELGIPAENRFNAGVNFNDRRFLGSLSLNYSDKAFWVDVLDRTFAGLHRLLHHGQRQLRREVERGQDRHRPSRARTSPTRASSSTTSATSCGAPGECGTF